MASSRSGRRSVRPPHVPGRPARRCQGLALLMYRTPGGCQRLHRPAAASQPVWNTVHYLAPATKSAGDGHQDWLRSGDVIGLVGVELFLQATQKGPLSVPVRCQPGNLNRGLTPRHQDRGTLMPWTPNRVLASDDFHYCLHLFPARSNHMFCDRHGSHNKQPACDASAAPKRRPTKRLCCTIGSAQCWIWMDR